MGVFVCVGSGLHWLVSSALTGVEVRQHMQVAAVACGAVGVSALGACVAVSALWCQHCCWKLGVLPSAGVCRLTGCLSTVLFCVCEHEQ